MAKKHLKKNTEKNTELGKIKRMKNLEKTKWKPGESGNPKGRHKGQRDYITIYREALKGLARKKNCTPEELENIIEQVGISKAIQGDYRFFQDFRDRIHGKPVQRNELTGANGKDLIPDPESKKAADDVIDNFLKEGK